MVFIYLIVISFLIGFALDKDRIRKKRMRFDDRQILTMDEIYSLYFCSKGLPKNNVTSHWVAISEMLKLDPGKLRPTAAIPDLKSQSMRKFQKASLSKAGCI